jgi:hypothetical protein
VVPVEKFCLYLTINKQTINQLTMKALQTLIAMKHLLSKKDIDVYRMSLYPDKGKKRGSDEMIDKIGQKLKNNDATKISYTRRSDDGVDVEFSIGDIKYKAIFNHTGTCEKLEKC